MYTTHTAGKVSATGQQQCTDCGKTLTSPGGTPWTEGTTVANCGSFWVDLEHVTDVTFFEECYPCNEEVH